LKTNSLKVVFCFIFIFLDAVLFAQSEIKGRLIKASRNGVDITKTFEPVVSVEQDKVMDVRTIKLRLEGQNSRDSKVYEFYNDGTENGGITWKRRLRGVVVQPLAVYITTAESGDANYLYINYEYRDKKGFGSVDYIIAIQK
jgi:hypothetical protein